MSTLPPDQPEPAEQPPAPDGDGPYRPYVDVSRRPRSFYVLFVLIEFWLVVAGVVLLILGPQLIGAIILALAVLIFILALLLG